MRKTEKEAKRDRKSNEKCVNEEHFDRARSKASQKIFGITAWAYKSLDKSACVC